MDKQPLCPLDTLSHYTSHKILLYFNKRLYLYTVFFISFNTHKYKFCLYFIVFKLVNIINNDYGSDNNIEKNIYNEIN